MADKIATNKVIKIGIVAQNADETADKLLELFDAVEPYDINPIPDIGFDEKKYRKYLGAPAGDFSIKVRMVYLEPVYLEIVEPVGASDGPWHEHLKRYGTSVCFIAFYIEGFRHHIDLMNDKGFPLLYEEDKGFERYAYFDTMDKLGFVLEMKERIPKK